MAKKSGQPTRHGQGQGQAWKPEAKPERTGTLGPLAERMKKAIPAGVAFGSQFAPTGKDVKPPKK
ncbi:MAG: hypothetical protein HYS44_02540 [Candidatus Niyogibacteria bacterium]|nr:hypothetical protein [Candidatus Niyogibacteria bacterium]